MNELDNHILTDAKRNLLDGQYIFTEAQLIEFAHILMLDAMHDMSFQEQLMDGIK